MIIFFLIYNLQTYFLSLTLLYTISINIETSVYSFVMNVYINHDNDKKKLL
jgi:hypothetical protein